MSTDREDRWGNDDQDAGFDAGADGSDSDVRERAKRKVRWPAFGLIAVGGIALALAGYFILTIASGSLAKDMDEQLEAEQKKLDDDPNLTAQQKKDAKEFQSTLLKGFVSVAPVFAVPLVISGLLVLVGGVKLLNLSGRGWPMFSAILAMIPCCMSYAFFGGIPIGIWVLVVLANPDVKAAMAMGSRRG